MQQLYGGGVRYFSRSVERALVNCAVACDVLCRLRGTGVCPPLPSAELRSPPLRGHPCRNMLSVSQ
eukprot:6172216-Pleurochrysis_carterae.AAC.2